MASQSPLRGQAVFCECFQLRDQVTKPGQYVLLFASAGHSLHPALPKSELLPSTYFLKTASDAASRPATPPKYVSWRLRSPTYRGPSSSLRTRSTSRRYSDEFAKLLVLCSHGVCWREDAIIECRKFMLAPGQRHLPPQYTASAL